MLIYELPSMMKEQEGTSLLSRHHSVTQLVNNLVAYNHGLLNISIWTGNERKKQRVGGQVEACAVVRLRI